MESDILHLPNEKTVRKNLYIKIFSLFPGIDQSNQVCSKDDQRWVYQNCKFHDPQGKVSCAGAWPYKSYSENALFL